MNTKDTMRRTKRLIALIPLWFMAAQCGVSPQNEAADKPLVATKADESPNTTKTKIQKRYEARRAAAAEAKRKALAGEFDPSLSKEELTKEKVRAHFKYTWHNLQKAHELGPAAVPFLLDIINQPDRAAELFGKDKVRREYRNLDAVRDALSALGAIGDERAVAPIIEWLESDARKEARRAMSLNGHLADALGHLAGQGNVRALAYLIEKIQSQNWNKSWRNYDQLGPSSAIMSLAISGRPEARSEFIKIRNLLVRKQQTDGALTGVYYEVIGTLESAFVAWEEVQVLGVLGYTDDELRRAMGLDKGGRGVP